MSSRRNERELALQLAYAMDITGDAFEDALFRFTAYEPKRQEGFGPFAEELIRKSVEHRETIDARIVAAAENWRLERMAATDRSLLRLAACELLYFPEIPSNVTMDEFVAIARRYSGKDSPKFVNGVLDALCRALPEKDFAVQKSSEEQP